MSVTSIIGGGVRLVRTQPKTVAIWAALYGVVMAVGMVVMRPMTATMLALQQQAAADAAAGVTSAPAIPPGWFGILFLFELLFCVLAVIAFAAVVRAVSNPTGDRFAYLRLGMDELRLIGLGVMLVIAAFIAEAIGILAVALVGVIAGTIMGQAATIVVITIAGLALLCGAIYAQVRLSLSGALTVLRGKIVIRDAWRITRGHFWTLFGVFTLLTAIFVVMTVVLIALTNPQLLAAYASLDQQATIAAAQQQIARQGAGFTLGMIVQLVMGAIVGTVAGAIGCGAIATAALQLGGTDMRHEEAGSAWTPR